MYLKKSRFKNQFENMKFPFNKYLLENFVNIILKYVDNKMFKTNLSLVIIT